MNEKLNYHAFYGGVNPNMTAEAETAFNEGFAEFLGSMDTPLVKTRQVTTIFDHEITSYSDKDRKILVEFLPFRHPRSRDAVEGLIMVSGIDQERVNKTRDRVREYSSGKGFNEQRTISDVLLC